MDQRQPFIARWGEHFLNLLVDAQDADALLGDFAEEYADRARALGDWKAGLWYWSQIAGSSRSLLSLRFHRELERRKFMNNTLIQDKRFIVIGLLALLPALLIVIPGALQSGLGITSLNDGLDAAYHRFPPLTFLIHPVILLGGLLLTFGLNLLPALGFHIERGPQGLNATVTFKKKWLHWALVGFSLLLVAILLGYSLTENFIITPR